MKRPELIISGGQTGADQGGLYGAEAVGIKTGGMMPKNYRTESGFWPELHERFGLNEHPTDRGYAARTEINVLMSDGTVIVGDTNSAGSKMTAALCWRHKKPFSVNPSPEQLRQFVEENNIKILNVAGNRESVNPGIFERTKQLIIDAFQITNEQA